MSPNCVSDTEMGMCTVFFSLFIVAHERMTVTLILLQMREEKLGEANWSTTDTGGK